MSEQTDVLAGVLVGVIFCAAGLLAWAMWVQL